MPLSHYNTRRGDEVWNNYLVSMQQGTASLNAVTLQALANVCKMRICVTTSDSKRLVILPYAGSYAGGELHLHHIGQHQYKYIGVGE